MHAHPHIALCKRHQRGSPREQPPNTRADLKWMGRGGGGIGLYHIGVTVMRGGGGDDARSLYIYING